jgi:ATP-binding cassette, subfamily B, multidrug efflux pump
VTPFRRLLGYARPYWRAFLLGIVCIVATRGIALVSPLVLRYAIDDLTRSVTRGKFAAYGALLLAIGVAGGVFRFYMRRILTGLSREIEYDMRNDFFAQLEKQPLRYFQTHRTGDLMSRATNDLGAVRMMVGPAVMYSADTALGFVAALSLMLSIDARLTVLSLIPLPFVSFCVWYFGSAIHRRFETIQEQLAEVSAVAQEALSGVRVIRAYRQEAAEVARFTAANEEYMRRNRRLIALQGVFFPSMAFLLGLGAMLVLWLGSQDVIRGRITLGQFVAFNMYLTMLSWPMIAFGWVTNMLQRGMASWTRMLDVLDAEPAIRDAESLVARPFQGRDSATALKRRPYSEGIQGEIEFRNLVFAYGDTLVLNGISARIEAGETVALIGVTGSGKSTLVNLIARLHDPPSGAIFVDGIDIHDIPIATLRGAIGFVPQEPFLFSDTIGDNVAFGLDAIAEGGVRRARLRPHRAEASEAEGEISASVRAGGGAPAPVIKAGAPAPVIEADSDRQRRIHNAAEIACLDRDVADFPKGYDTEVGERGITLSGGQKQRAAIARAIVTDPRILILDDALSAVDTYTEEEILSRLRTVMRQRTSIIVSHRISTVRDADRIFVLDAGHIVERGSHDELIRANGLYAALHKKQLLEDELAAS